MAWTPLKTLPDDGKHNVTEKLPEPNVQLSIDCKEDIGGAATFGEDGKWYWTYDWQRDAECTFTVESWRYLGYPGPDAESIEYLREKYEDDP